MKHPHDESALPLLEGTGRRLPIERRTHRRVRLRRVLRSATAKGGNNSFSRRNDLPGDERLYQTGEIVPDSGIYEIVHHSEHREPHSAILIKGQLFRGCETCGQAVSYRLVRTAPYILHDDDFRQRE